MTKPSLLLLLLLLWAGALSAQLTFVVTQLPPNTSDRVELYLAGTFNNWSPKEEDYRLQKNEDGFFALTIDPPSGDHQFKFTRGSWATVEGDAGGQFRPDRKVTYKGRAQTVYCNIKAWEGAPRTKKSTAADNVLILDEKFYMPQLDRNRRIWVYLPPAYYESDQAYPVIYLQDGQNVFDEATSYAGEWKVDESLNQIRQQGGQGFIAVAIDNGRGDRMSEYAPWAHSKYGGGRGAEYVRFLVETLKPYIDKNFRTLPEPENTAIFGSSMGGLISMYAAIEYPEVFGKAGVFSPSFWFSEGQAFWQVLEKGQRKDLKIYMICGAEESRNMKSDVLAMTRTLLTAGFAPEQVYQKIHTDGDHKEWYWAREFPQAMYWLFGKNENTPGTRIRGETEVAPIFIRPQSEKEYEIVFEKDMDKPKYSLVDLNGRPLSKPKKLKLKDETEVNGKTTATFKIRPPKHERFYMQIFDDEELIVVKKF